LTRSLDSAIWIGSVAGKEPGNESGDRADGDSGQPPGKDTKMKSALGAISVGLLACVVFGAGILRAETNQQNKKAAAASEKTKQAAPASGCAMLTPALLAKVLGQPFEDKHEESKFPPAYDGPWGWTCEYASQKSKSQGGVHVEFRVYTEASAAIAKQTFDKVAVFFANRSKPRPSVGDEAYWGTGNEPVIHVLKGKVHYSIAVYPSNAKQAQDVATALAATL
jgi:hypothetical protein